MEKFIMRNIILLIVLFIANILFATDWNQNYLIPDLSDTLWVSAKENRDTLIVMWDNSNINDSYIFYATIVDAANDSVKWIGNYSEKITNWDSGSTDTSSITMMLPPGLYMCQLVAVKSNKISDPSDPAWLNIKSYIHVPKHFRIIIMTIGIGKKK